MQGDTIVFFSKYTTLSGSVSGSYAFYSDPYDLTAFNQVDVEVYMAAFAGATKTVDAVLQESNDLESWNDVTSGSVTITANGSNALSVSNTSRYIRMVLRNWGGTDNIVTFWAKGVVRNT